MILTNLLSCYLFVTLKLFHISPIFSNKIEPKNTLSYMDFFQGSVKNHENTFVEQIWLSTAFQDVIMKNI